MKAVAAVIRAFFASFVFTAACAGPCVSTAFAQNTTLPIHQTFASAGNTEGWSVFGSGATADIVAGTPDRPTGGALRFDYSVGKGGVSALALGIHAGDLTGARAFRFLVRADYSAPLVLALQEKGGGRYMAVFTVPKDTWQAVELTAADFALSQGANDPIDGDNKLDLDQVESIAIADLSGIFAQMGNPAVDNILQIKTGAHRLFLADFTISADPAALIGSIPPKVNPRGQAQRIIDTFSHPQVGWIALGSTAGAPVITRAGKPLNGRGMRIDYQQAPGKAVVLIKPLTHGFLTGRSGITLAIASVHAATMVVQVEEHDGGPKYAATFYVPAGAEGENNIAITFADFKLADDSKDPTGKIDLTKVTQIFLIDSGGLTGAVTEAVDNTIYVGDIRAVR